MIFANGASNMEDDQEYYSRRIQQETLLAELADRDEVRAIHLNMANYYSSRRDAADSLSREGV